MKYLYLKTTQDHKKGDVVEFSSGSIIAEQLEKLGITAKYQDEPKENKAKGRSKKVDEPKENKVAGPEEQK
jgi:hypothetical protein